MNNHKHSSSEEDKFEIKLFQSLKAFGYLFPTNEKDIKRFEQLYGDTEIDLPSHLQSLESIENNQYPQDSDLGLRIAALSSKKDVPGDLFQDFDDDSDNSDSSEGDDKKD